MPSFDEWFKGATGNCPFPYQRRFVTDGEIPQLVDVPVGARHTPHLLVAEPMHARSSPVMITWGLILAALRLT
jgi:hypothetical protein